MNTEIVALGTTAGLGLIGWVVGQWTKMSERQRDTETRVAVLEANIENIDKNIEEIRDHLLGGGE